MDALRDVLHDYDTMKAILSFIYDVMDESPGLIISEEELRTVTSLMEHVENIKRECESFSVNNINNNL